MINWHILSASANNGCMRVSARPRMKKDIIAIAIMRIIRINGATRVVAVQTCLGMRAHCNAAEWHGSHGYSGVSVAHDMCMRVRLCACLCGIVGTCLCCHGLRCGSSSRRPGHGRPDSPPSASLLAVACDRMKLEGIVRTFGNLPAWNERLEARGAHGMRALRVCTGTKAAAPASANALSGWLRSSEMASDECLPKLQGEFQCGNIRMESQSARGMMQKRPLRAARRSVTAQPAPCCPPVESTVLDHRLCWNLSFGRSVHATAREPCESMWRILSPRESAGRSATVLKSVEQRTSLTGFASMRLRTTGHRTLHPVARVLRM